MKKDFSSPRRKSFIMGRNTIRAVLVHSPKRIVEIFTSTEEESDSSLIQEASKHQIPIRKVGKKDLFQKVQSESHQGYVALVKEKPYLELRDFLANTSSKEKSLVLLLDSINDPQNFGALLRAAACFRIDGVIWSKNRGVDITPVVTKTSVGASEIVPLIQVSNLVESVKRCQKEGYFALCADVDTKAQSLYGFSFPEKTILIMGSEGKGIQPLLKKTCDGSLYIPMEGWIDSLNVSQATAVFLSSWKRQKA